MKSDAMVGTSIRLPKSLKDDATRLARQDHRKFGQVVRIALEQYVGKRNGNKKVA